MLLLLLLLLLLLPAVAATAQQQMLKMELPLLRLPHQWHSEQLMQLLLQKLRWGWGWGWGWQPLQQRQQRSWREACVLLTLQRD